MANLLNGTCQICGKKYHYCGDCRKYGNWRSITDTPEHYQIAMILTEYREHIIDAKEAAECFNNYGITLDSDFSEYLEAVARDIKAIIKKGTAKKSVKTGRKTVEKTTE